MSNRSFVLSLVVAVLFAGLSGAVYRINQTERGILLRFGAVQVADIPPGLHFKLPFADEVKKFDGRVLTLESNPQTYFTLEKKPLMVDSFAKWRIVDVEKYYTKSSGDEKRAEGLLLQRVATGLRDQISRRDMHEVISGKRDELMSELTADLDSVMREEFGVEVIDVRVKKIDLPPEVSNSVYERMVSEREVEARQHRATGKELAAGIEADADRRKIVIEAEAYRTAEEVRGRGDAEAAGIYAEAYNADPEFYAFHRSLAAYRRVFRGDGDVMVIDPSSEFFEYLQSERRQ